ncbi:MAG: YbaB/EbfC family nucleoid-associated protein [Anaerolineae bacterium]|nr:YbaB/EbfC family nucleoid-associated protein [Thermoflexales bacterium]MDW8408657.1 YbaB/EbfC family nucleoid-associated protein [Anaerolineae bacterium]
MAKGRRSDWTPRGPVNPQADMLNKLQKIQEEMRKTQEELENEIVNVTAAGGAITIAITGHQRVQSIKIDPGLIDPNDPSMLEDALVAAVNEAILASQTHSAQRLEAITGGLNIPGLI